MYTLSGFDVTRSNSKFRLTDGPVSIRFSDGTAFEKVATPTRIIPTEHFRFRSYEQILELANTGKQLPGVTSYLFLAVWFVFVFGCLLSHIKINVEFIR